MLGGMLTLLFLETLKLPLWAAIPWAIAVSTVAGLLLNAWPSVTATADPDQPGHHYHRRQYPDPRSGHAAVGQGHPRHPAILR